MSDENPELEKGIDAAIDWIVQCLEQERDLGMEAVIRVVDGLDEEKAKTVVFCLLVAYATDLRERRRLVEQLRSAPNN
jgi:hypothetical protein